MKKGCIFFSALFFLWSLPRLQAQPQKLYLNPATAAAASQSKFVEITRFITIDPSEKVDGNTSLIVTRKYWVLYNYFEKKVSVFSKQGVFLKSLSLKKYGVATIVYDDKNDVLKFNIRNKNYTLTAKDLLHIRANYAKKANQKYFKNYEIDLNDPALQIRQTATDPYFIINAKWYYDDFYYLSDLNTDPAAKDSLGYELQILKDYKPVTSFFPFNKKANNIFRYAAGNYSTNLSNTDTSYIRYFSRILNTTIYKLNKDSITPVYEIILPAENAMPQQYLKNGFKSKTDWESFQNSNGAVFYSINSIRNVDRYLFFAIRYMRNYESFVYDKKGAKFFKSKMIKADSSQYNIQLLQNGIGAYENGYYYTIVPAQGLVEFYTGNKEKNISYPPELDMYLKNATKNSNPVIVQYKIKD